MISSTEAETMDYLTYKRTLWRRLLDWWRGYQPDHPERAEFVEKRLLICQGQLDYWNGRA